MSHIIKIAHESPIVHMKNVANLTHYDYALVHLFEEQPEYLDYFKNNKDRETILDNSIFELGTAFDADKFVYWINETSPSWYIIPDTFKDHKATINQVIEWNELQKPFILTNSLSIGVCQGNTFEEVIECYKEIEPLVDKVAIGFMYDFFNQEYGETKMHKWMNGRIRLLDALDKNNIINRNKPHHLLGCSLPQEFKGYNKYEWIDSLDTSNPVMIGYEKQVYDDYGVDFKPETKLFTIIDQPLNNTQKTCINENIIRFHGFVNG